MLKNKFIKELTFLFQKPYTKDKIIDGISLSILGGIWFYSLNKSKDNKLIYPPFSGRRLDGGK